MDFTPVPRRPGLHNGEKAAPSSEEEEAEEEEEEEETHFTIPKFPNQIAESKYTNYER